MYISQQPYIQKKTPTTTNLHKHLFFSETICKYHRKSNRNWLKIHILIDPSQLISVSTITFHNYTFHLNKSVSLTSCSVSILNRSQFHSREQSIYHLHCWFSLSSMHNIRVVQCFIANLFEPRRNLFLFINLKLLKTQTRQQSLGR